MSGQSFVYFIRADAPDARVKVGATRDLASRLKNCQAHSPVPLTLIASIPCEESHKRRAAQAIERQLHERYMRWHLHHEWFRYNPLLAADLEAIAAGAFDPAQLPAFTKASWHLPGLALAA